VSYDPETTPVLLVDAHLLDEQTKWADAKPEDSHGSKSGLVNLLDEILIHWETKEPPVYVTLKLLDGGWADE
jgi:hypothetical protein